MLTITSHRNLGHPSPPVEISHGAGPCHSSKVSLFSLEKEFNEDLFLPFFLEALGLRSDSFSKIFSPNFLTTGRSASSMGSVLRKEDLKDASSTVTIPWGNLAVVVRKMCKASTDLILRIALHVSGSLRTSFNPRFMRSECRTASPFKHFPKKKKLINQNRKKPSPKAETCGKKEC